MAGDAERLIPSSLMEARRRQSIIHRRRRRSLTFTIDGNIYRYCNYEKSGLLTDVYEKHGKKGLNREFRLMIPFMYCSGRGITVKDSVLDLNGQGVGNGVNFDPLLTQSTRRICWKLGFRGVYGESLLHILIICNTETHTEVAKLLLAKFPSLVHDIFESDEYYGTSSLHLSIAYRNSELTELLLELGANIHGRASGTFFMPTDQIKESGILDVSPQRVSDFAGLAYLGEYPLSWAVCLDDKVTYNLLIRHGADPNLQDTFGNMILHVVVATGRPMFYSFALKHPFRQAQDDIINVYGLTPLSMACLLGRDKVFGEIVEMRCFEFWTYSIITCCGYPLGLIDSLQLVKTKDDAISAETDSNSALTLISSGSSEEHIEMLRGGIVHQLLEEKWKTFGYVKFTRNLMTTFVYLLTVSLVVFLRPSRTNSSSSSSSSLISSSESCLHHEDDRMESLKFWARSIAEVLTTIACLKLLLNHVIEVASNGWSNYLHGLKKRVPLLVFSLSNILILVSFILRVVTTSTSATDNLPVTTSALLTNLEDVLLSVSLPLSWYFLIFFAAGIKLTGPFVSMIRYMLVKDMTQFAVIYLIFIYAFSQAFFFQLKKPVQMAGMDNYAVYDKTWMETWMSMYLMTLGSWDYDELRSSSMSLMFFVLFLILVPILLLNMLIAMMGNTYSEIIGKSEREFALQWANILVEIERTLHKKELSKFVDQYAIVSKELTTTLMVIKRMSKSKAKQRLEALSNWKRLRWKLRTFLKSQDKPL